MSKRPPLLKLPMSLPVALLALAAIALAYPAGALDVDHPDDLCDPLDDPCVIFDPAGALNNNDVISGTTLDFGARAVELDGQLRVGEGSATILAASLKIRAGGILRARGDIGGTLVVTTTGDIEIGNSGATGTIQMRGNTEGGDLTLTAGGSIFGSGVINVSGGEAGGTADLTALSIDLTGRQNFTGSSLGTGGLLSITSIVGDVNLLDVDVSGGDAGELIVTSAGAATLGSIVGRATGDAGSGPFIDTFSVTAAGPITLNGEVDAVGGTDGDGGELRLTAGTPGARQDVTLSGPIKLYSRGDFGSFGLFEVFGDTVEMQDLIDVSGGQGGNGSDALAGDVLAEAETALNLPASGNIKVRAGVDGMAGLVTLTSGGSMTLVGPVEADAGDSGGIVTLSAQGDMDLAGLIDVSGDEFDSGEIFATSAATLTASDRLLATSSLSDGGTVLLEGCFVDVEPAAELDAAGAFCNPFALNDPYCRILVNSRGQMSLAGDFVAGTGGLIQLSYRDPARLPDVTGATFDLTPVEVEDPTLPACDSDMDGFDDDVDNCAMDPNPFQDDADLDGAGDLCDNCTLVANGPLVPDAGGNVQLDQDGDGFGGVCDCDFDNSGSCDILDFNGFLGDFTTGTDSGIGSDMNGTGTVDILDFNTFLSGFGLGVPGPSGVAP